MKKTLSIFFLSLVALFSFIALPLDKTFAQHASDHDIDEGGGGPGSGSASAGTATAGIPTIKAEYLKNPIKVNSITDFIKTILDFVLKIGVPIVAFFIIYSGFQFVVARGNAEKLESAKRMFIYTLIGAAILMGAWVIAQIIGETISQIAK